jgi:hypothetical protein
VAVRTLKAETQEALTSAFYMMPFTEFLGENDMPGEERGSSEHIMWFHIGEKPKDMRVSIIQPDRVEEVRVVVEWRNYFANPREPLSCTQTFTVKTYAASEADLQQATGKVVESVLTIYQDILSEEGVAGDIQGLTPEVEDTDDEDAE